MIEQFAKHKVAANLTMIMMVLAGLWSLRVMPTQLDPPATFPVVWVTVTWPGASAEDMEALVTNPIEQQLRTINQLKELNSRTQAGQMRISVTFEHDADLTMGLDDVKQRVANIRNMPQDIEPPEVRPLIDMEPISVLLVSGSGTISDLIPVVRKLERSAMASGVDGVFFSGLPTEEIALMIGGRRLAEAGMTLPEIAAQIALASRNVPAGEVGHGQGTRQLRSLEQRHDPHGFERLPLQVGDQLVHLGDIADVVRRPQRGEPAFSTRTRATVEMMLWRQTHADARAGDQMVSAWLERVRPTLPAGVELTEAYNIWQLLGAQLDMIAKNALSGLVLVIGILFVFLNARVGWWVMVGIPVSFLMGLALFHMGFGHGISIIALIGFIMALGIVVDDAIVVGEDIVTHFEHGATPEAAAIAGARRMWTPVVTSSLTTLAAFIPLLLIGGVMGELVLTLPTVLLCIIAASLIECFLVLPAHLKGSLSAARDRKVPQWRQRFRHHFEAFRDTRFMPFVRAALDAPVTTLTCALGGVALALALLMSQHVGFSFVTGFDFESLKANVTFSASATPTQRDAFVGHLESTLADVNRQYDERNVTGYVSKRNFAEFGSDAYNGEQHSSIEAYYIFEEERTLAPDTFARLWRERVQQPPYVEQLTIATSGGQNGGEPDLTLVLSGDDLLALKNGAQALREALSTYPGVNNVTDNLPYGGEQIIFEVTPQARALGLSPTQIGNQLRSAYNGVRVQIFNENDHELEVRAMLTDAERNDLASLQRFPVRTADGSFVPLANVARLSSRRGIDVIRHTNGRMAVRVSADVDTAMNNAIAVTSAVQTRELPDILERYDLEAGLGGKSEQDRVLMETMALGGLLTLVLIYLILAWVFASYLWPLAIMMAIPFGFTGAVFGHWVTGWDVGAMSLLAFFSLTGIVVNDSIVLVSFFKRRLGERADDLDEVKAALVNAVRARFRAVVLTTLTTVAGLLPLMFETSTLAFYVAPIAVTICFGLALATLLVLVVVPALIVLLEGARRRARSLFFPTQRHRANDSETAIWTTETPG